MEDLWPPIAVQGPMKNSVAMVVIRSPRWQRCDCWIVVCIVFVQSPGKRSPWRRRRRLARWRARRCGLWQAAFNSRPKVYHAVNVDNQRRLVVVLHGDAVSTPSYQYEFARVAASQIDNVIIAAPLRPGYCDDTGDCSSGKRGLTTGDNYTEGVVDAVAQAVEQLRGRYHAAKVVLVGPLGRRRHHGRFAGPLAFESQRGTAGCVCQRFGGVAQAYV